MFSFSSTYIFISLETFFLIHGLFRTACLVFICLEIFPLSVHYCFLVWLHVVRGYPLYDFNPFKFVEFCFMAQNMVYLSMHVSPGYLKSMCTLLLLGGVLYLLDPGDWWYWVLLSPCWFSNCSVNWWREGCWRAQMKLWICLFFFQFHQFLFCMVCSSVVRCIDIWNCYVFLVDWPFYHVNPFLSLEIFFVLKSLSFWCYYSPSCPAFFWLLIHNFFHPFTFILYFSYQYYIWSKFLWMACSFIIFFSHYQSLYLTGALDH